VKGLKRFNKLRRHSLHNNLLFEKSGLGRSFDDYLTAGLQDDRGEAIPIKISPILTNCFENDSTLFETVKRVN